MAVLSSSEDSTICIYVKHAAVSGSLLLAVFLDSVGSGSTGLAHMASPHGMESTSMNHSR